MFPVKDILVFSVLLTVLYVLSGCGVTKNQHLLPASDEKMGKDRHRPKKWKPRNNAGRIKFRKKLRKLEKKKHRVCEVNVGKGRWRKEKIQLYLLDWFSL